MKVLKPVLTAMLVAMLAACSEEPASEAGGAGADSPTEWRFALEEIQGSVQDAYAQKFAELVEAKTDGAIRVTVYPYGALGTSAQLTELVQQGALEFAFASPGHLGSVVPEVQVFSLHFLLSDSNAVNKQVLGESPILYGPLAEAYREKGLKLLTIIPEGWMVWTANRPLTTPDDFRGLKIRTMVSPLLVASYQAYGADPTPMPYSEVYSGLQLGMIDAQVNPIFAIEEMSFYEVQKAMTMARHSQFVASVVASQRFYESLTTEEQVMLDEVKRELDDYIFEVQTQYNAERLERIRQNSDIEIVELNDEQRAAFAELARPVRDRYRAAAGERGAQILEGLVEEIRQSEAALGQQQAAGAE